MMSSKACLLIFLLSGLVSHSQQMVQTPNDLLIVCQKDEQFIGKSLNELLKEFKPQIQMVFADGGGLEQVSSFTFYFASRQVYNKYGLRSSFPIHVRVLLKEIFDWDYQSRRKIYRNHYLDWTEEDQKKYGNLTIIGIRVNGEYAPCDNYSDENL